MTRVLTGIQSTGIQHLGNLLGAILPAIAMSRTPDHDALLFIADLHSLTTLRDPKVLRENTYSAAATWLAAGLDPDRVTFYRQSDVPEVTELTWYLGCLTPFPMLANAHSFKDKSARLSEVSAGLFYYPVLMTADIVLYDANVVPVGKDQLQHIEIARDITGAINRQYGADTLVVPEARLDEQVMVVPGTDGQKMSKSYGNTIVPFLTEKDLKKQVMGIVSDSRTLEEPKDPDHDNTFKLFSLVAPPDRVQAMRENYLRGNYGYGHAKKELLEVLLTTYAGQRDHYQRLMNDRGEMDRLLKKGADKACTIASATLQRVRERVGYGPMR